MSAVIDALNESFAAAKRKPFALVPDFTRSYNDVADSQRRTHVLKNGPVSRLNEAHPASKRMTKRWMTPLAVGSHSFLDGDDGENQRKWYDSVTVLILICIIFSSDLSIISAYTQASCFDSHEDILVCFKCFRRGDEGLVCNSLQADMSTW